MAERTDKRRRTDLDLFVLALIEDGLSTPFELQKTAGLSQGATVPTLRRLLEARLVRQGRSGPRGKIAYQVTAVGRKSIAREALALFEAGPSGDPDPDLRVALLAMRSGASRNLAAKFLEASAVLRLESLDMAGREDETDVLVSIAHWYSELRLQSRKTLLEAEASALKIQAESLPYRLGSNSPSGAPSIKTTKRR